MSTKTITSGKSPLPNTKSSLHQKRYLVLGSTGHVGVSSCTWKQAATLTIPDYDIIVVDMPSLGLEAQKVRLTLQEVTCIRTGLLRVLASGGHVIVVADIARNIVVHIASDSPRETKILNYLIIPITVDVYNESGESITLFPTNRYFGYLSKLKTWQFHFEVKTTLRDPASQQIVGQHGFIFNQTEIFMANREGRILAAEYKLAKPLEALAALFSQTSQRALPQNPQGNVSTLTVLPCSSILETSDAIAEIIAALSGKAIDVPIPEWALVTDIPGVNEIDREISGKDENIRDLSAQIEELTSKRNRLLSFRKLLYSEGQALEEIVKQTLQYLGGRIRRPPILSSTEV